MKSKLLFTLFISSVINFSAQCQTFKANFSDEWYNSYNSFGNSVLVNSGKIILKTNNEQKFLSQNQEAKILLVNEKMETIRETQVTFKANRFIDIGHLYKINDNVILIYAYKNERKDKEFSISALKINTTDFSTKDVILGTFPTSSGPNIPTFDFTYSIDSSKYLLFFEPKQDKKDNKQFYYAVFDSDLQKNYDKNIELPTENRYTIVEGRTLDSKDNLFIEFKYFEKEVKDRKSIWDEDESTPPYSAELKEYSKNNKEATNILLNIPGKFLHSSELVLNKKTKKINIAGTYKNDAKGKISGVFYCDFDEVSQSLINIKSSDIPDDIVRLFDMEKIGSTSKKSPGISGNFREKGLKFRNNGTVDYILEYDRRVEKYISGNSLNGMSTQSFFKYYCQSILNINIDGNGKMIFTRIPKNQTDINEESYVSHYSFYSGNKLVFLYNDSEDNVDRDLEKKPDDIDASSRKSVLMAAIVDEKGNLKREVIYEHDKYVTLVHDISTITANSFFVTKRKTATSGNEHTKMGILEVSQ